MEKVSLLKLAKLIPAGILLSINRVEYSGEGKGEDEGEGDALVLSSALQPLSNIKAKIIFQTKIVCVMEECFIFFLLLLYMPTEVLGLASGLTRGGMRLSTGTPVNVSR